MAAANSGFALWGRTFFVETFVVKQTFVLLMNISAKNPPQPKAAKRTLAPILRYTTLTRQLFIWTVFLGLILMSFSCNGQMKNNLTKDGLT